MRCEPFSSEPSNSSSAVSHPTLYPRRDRAIPGKEGGSQVRHRPLPARRKREITESEHAEDLRLLRELDLAGRVPGQPVDTLDDVLDYLKGLEHESYLDE